MADPDQSHAPNSAISTRPATNRACGAAILAARPRRWLVRWALLLLGLLLLTFAAVTFRQAWAMTHYRPATARTTKLAALSTWGKAGALLTGPIIRRQLNTRDPGHFGMPFETLRFPGAHGLKIEAWRIAGKAGAPSVLMFPGYGASKDTLFHAAREFAALGCEIWMVDPHGIGGSEGSITSVGYHETDDVAAAFQEARKLDPARKIILYGTSMGAVAILRAVHTGVAAPDALILECPFDRFTNTIGVRFSLLGLPRFPFAEAVAFWVGAQQGFNGLAHNPATYARSVRCPTLLLQGALDESVGPAFVRNVAQNLGPAATFVLIPDAGHAFLARYSPEVWRKSVHAFVSEKFSLPLSET